MLILRYEGCYYELYFHFISKGSMFLTCYCYLILIASKGKEENESRKYREKGCFITELLLNCFSVEPWLKHEDIRY